MIGTKEGQPIGSRLTIRSLQILHDSLDFSRRWIIDHVERLKVSLFFDSDVAVGVGPKNNTDAVR